MSSCEDVNCAAMSSANAGPTRTSQWKPFAFNKDQIRVLLFRECDWRGRKLLFDSQAVQKVAMEKACKLGFVGRQKTEKNKKDTFVEVTNGFGYQYSKPSADASLIGEMMFGAVAMTYRGTAMKVHSMPDPDRLMCTKVFPSSEIHHCRRRTSLEDSLGSSLNSMSGSEADGGCVRDVPRSSGGDSGFCGDLSLRSVSSVGSWTPLNSPAGSRNSVDSTVQSGGCGGGGRGGGGGGSLSSLQRRWARSVSTSLELAAGGSVDATAGSTAHRRTRLGLCVVVTLSDEQRREMEAYIFEHISLVEAALGRLRLAVERAYVRKDTFVHAVHEAWLAAQQSFHDLFCLPRLARPLWLGLGMGAAGEGHAGLAATFLQDLCQLIATLDTKATNFFVSTLITAVLTHHLGWVNTVWPPNTQPPNTQPPQTTQLTQLPTAAATQSLTALSRSHPYNPLWAQLGDLTGALGAPCATARTVLTSGGRKPDVAAANKLLAALSYFIRCGEVKEAVGLRYQPDAADVTNSASTQTLLPSASTEFVAPPPPSPGKRKAGSRGEGAELRRDAAAEILGRETNGGNGGGRNFCSPAGAEWENDGELRGAARETSEIGDGSRTSVNSRSEGADGNERSKSDVVNGVLHKSHSSLESIIQERVPKRDDSCERDGGAVSNGAPRTMKRSPSCRDRLAPPDPGVGIYPDIGHLARLENIRLRDRSPQETETESGLEDDAGKAVRLSLPVQKLEACSVETRIARRTAAKTEPGLEDDAGKAIRLSLPVQKLEACSVEPRIARRTEAESQRRAPASEVLFILGDGEELKGIKRRSTSDLVAGNVVMVRSTQIELEDERGDSKTERGVEAKPRVLCCASVDLPIDERKRIDEVTKVFRRRLETYCSRCSSLLRARHPDAATAELLACEKCRYAKLGQEAGFRRARTQRAGLASAGASPEEEAAGAEGHAVFDGFSPSDEETPAFGRRRGRERDAIEFGFDELRLLEMPMPRCPPFEQRTVGLAASLLGGASPRYVPDLVLQACVSPPIGWEAELRRDLALAARSSPLGPDVTEAVAVVADTHAWEVHLVSSRTFAVDRPGTLGVRVGMSQLVANMLESLVLLHRLKTPPRHCLSHIESRLRELVTRSRALAELLLSAEMCSMRTLTSALDLEPNDVPLLLAVAATHSPAVAQRYGLTFV